MTVGRQKPAATRQFSPIQLAMVEMDEHHGAATWQNLFMVYWNGQTKADAVTRLTRPLLDLKAENPSGIHLIQVVAAKSGPPSNEARTALVALLRAASSGTISSSLVVPGVGFRMAAARAFATGLIMVVQLRFPHEVYASVERAAAWHCDFLASHAARSIAPWQIVAAVGQLTREVESFKGADGSHPRIR